MMIILTILFWVATLILVGYACFPAVSLFFSAFPPRKKLPARPEEHSFDCLVTAYQVV